MARIDIGIDAGGTRTRLEARSSSGESFSLRGPGANPRVIGIERSQTVMREVMLEACGTALHGADVYVCAGIAGASTEDVQSVIRSGLQDALKEAARAEILITDDATTSFEASFSGGPGTVLLLGTGSNIICKTLDGRWIHSGGWGYLIGDEGSGFAVGRLGLRAVARAIDRGRKSRLASRAAADFGLTARDNFLAAVYGGSLKIAEFARIVLDEASCGDIEAKLIVSESVGLLIDDLASTVETEAASLPRVIRVVGGLSRSNVYMQELRAGIAVRLGEDWEIGPSERAPVEGALWLASQMKD